MNPNLNWAIAAEHMQTLEAKADAARRARYAARVRRTAAHVRQARRSRRGLAFAPAGTGR